MMEAEATPRSAPGETARPTGVHAWRWAVATVLGVAIILGVTFAVHSAAARLRHPPATPAPALPMLAVTAVTAPDAAYELTALDTSLGRVVALSADHQPQCLPEGHCPSAPVLTHLVLLDGSTGQVLATTPLTGAAAAAVNAAALLVDETRHLAYAVAPRAVTIFSTETGAVAGGLPLGVALGDTAVGGAALDPTSDRVFVTEGAQLLAAHRLADDLSSVQRVSAPAGVNLGPVLDERDDLLYTLHQGASAQGATLFAVDPATLATLARATLPTNATLGPIDPTTGALSLLGADGHTYRATFASGQITLVGDGPAHALALGWNPALGHSYVAHTDDVQVLDAAGKAIAALPVRVYRGASLLTDPARNLLYLTANGGSLIIAQDAATTPTGVPNAATAIVGARAALANYLPDTNQDPPFLDTETFWPGVTTSAFDRDFYIHFSDLGWTGPYTGSATTACAPLSGHPNSYRVTFTVTWQQLFRRSHTWTLDVAFNGGVSYVSDSGDALP